MILAFWVTPVLSLIEIRTTSPTIEDAPMASPPPAPVVEESGQVLAKAVEEKSSEKPRQHIPHRFAAPEDRLKYEWMRAAGIDEADFQYVNFIVQKESGFNHLAINLSSGAQGLCQSLPGTKMAIAGADWETNPITQLRWCDMYAKQRYQGWANAYQFWIANSWW